MKNKNVVDVVEVREMERLVYLFFILVSGGNYVVYCQNGSQPATVYQHQLTNLLQRTITIGPCRIVINPQCPDPDVTFWMYSTAHPENPEPIYVATHIRGTNLRRTRFDPRKPSKVIIHGYNSNMLLSALTELRKEYLKTNDYNVFAVDWSPLNQSPCYPAAVWNARHVGTCTAQLIDRIRDLGAVDIHVIGFSLGAHITNYLSLALRPYRLPHITGLDPALPGYVTANIDEKLDRSDADFVDVYHTNAFMQGKAEESGHVDFYFNNGAIQPGCWGTENFFSCNHHRAPLYYAESINSPVGFWGCWCPGYFNYLAGQCPPNDVQVLVGDRVHWLIRGTYIVLTAASSPFALGPFNISLLEIDQLNQLPYLANLQAGKPISDLQVPPSLVPLIEQYKKNVLNPSAMDEEEMYNTVLNENFGFKSSDAFADEFEGFQRFGQEVRDNGLN